MLMIYTLAITYQSCYSEVHLIMSPHQMMKDLLQSYDKKIIVNVCITALYTHSYLSTLDLQSSLEHWGEDHSLLDSLFF